MDHTVTASLNNFLPQPLRTEGMRSGLSAKKSEADLLNPFDSFFRHNFAPILNTGKNYRQSVFSNRFEPPRNFRAGGRFNRLMNERNLCALNRTSKTNFWRFFCSDIRQSKIFINNIRPSFREDSEFSLHNAVCCNFLAATGFKPIYSPNISKSKKQKNIQILSEFQRSNNREQPNLRRRSPCCFAKTAAQNRSDYVRATLYR